MAALQQLPARQRAVLILREVLGFSAQEVAETLDSTVASVNSALQRARARRSTTQLPDQSQQATLRALGDKQVQELVETYMRAWEAGDVDTIVGLLTEDVTMAMPPMPTWFRGLEASTGFLTNFVFARRDAAHGARVVRRRGAARAARADAGRTGSRRSATITGTRRPARTCRSRCRC